MGVLNIVWIVLFLVLGAGLTFQAFEAVNFFIWDNLFGIAMFVVALFGIYCLTKDTIPFVRRLSEKLEPRKHTHEAGHSGFSTGRSHSSAGEEPAKSRRISARGSRGTQEETPERRVKLVNGGPQAENHRKAQGKPAPPKGTAGSTSAKNSTPAEKNRLDSAGEYTEDLDRILKEVDDTPLESGTPFITTDDIDLNDLLK